MALRMPKISKYMYVYVNNLTIDWRDVKSYKYEIGSDWTMNKPNIVILGAGYGGMITTVKLQKQLGVNEANITLVNENDYHYISTSLHETAAGTLHHDRT